MVSLASTSPVTNNNSNANASDIRSVRQESAIVVGSSNKSKSNLQTILNESKKFNMMIALRSSYSEELEFVNLKETNLNGKFTYNFYASSESWSERDVTIQEDPAKDPLSKDKLVNVPMYVKINWDTVSTSEDISVEERDNLSASAIKSIDVLKKASFMDKRGISNFYSSANVNKSSYEKYKKKQNPMRIDGIPTEIVDIDHLDKAIDSTSNKQVFSNTIGVVLEGTPSTTATAFGGPQPGAANTNAPPPTPPPTGPGGPQPGR
jgi:hypothetical protein